MTPLQQTPANICINLILPETMFPGSYIFVADNIWVALQILEQFCPKAGDAYPSVAKSKTDFNAKMPFKVIYFGIIKEPLRGYIAQYNKCGLRCEGSEARERKKRKSLFSTTPLSSEPPRISA